MSTRTHRMDEGKVRLEAFRRCTDYLQRFFSDKCFVLLRSGTGRTKILFLSARFLFLFRYGYRTYQKQAEVQDQSKFGRLNCRERKSLVASVSFVVLNHFFRSIINLLRIDQ